MKDQNSVGTMFDVLAEAMRPHTQLMKLNAIWIEGGVRAFNGYDTEPRVKLRHRISKGDVVSLDNNNKIIDFNIGEDNWEIVDCLGTIDNSILNIKLINLTTEEIKTVTI